MLILGIPTHVRHDLCDRAIASAMTGSVSPDLVYVVDNYGGYATHAARVVTPPANLGVARSWNLFAGLARPHDLLLANDDVTFGAGAIAAALARPEPVVLLAGYACALYREEAWQRVGLFDESYWPAYFEDNDWARRAKLAGVAVADLTDQHMVEHVGSATLQSVPDADRETMHRRFRDNRDYYARKWGGPPGEETHWTPFGRLPRA